MIKDETVTEQSKILNYQALSDHIVHPIVENLVLPEWILNFYNFFY